MLGPVEVLRDDRLVPIPAGKTSELLVRLALDVGVRVRSDRLIEDLWEAGAAGVGRNTLESKVSQLRRALGDRAAVAGGDGGYRLAGNPTQVDAIAVMRQAADASHLLDVGDDRGAAALSASTLAMYRGDEVLPGAGDWAAPYRTRLDAARLTLVETGLAARLRSPGDRELLGDLEAAVGAHPFHENLWVMLMTALYRAGRQADALDAYRRARAMLADELGLAPGPQLRELEQRILDHDETLNVAAATTDRSRPSRTGNLPSMSAALVGRDIELAELVDLISTQPLVEIVGPGGIGKTAVAIATGRALRPPGGVWLARLDMASSADDVVDTVVASLQVTGGEAALVDRLRRAEIVVILDNCEHVVEAAAGLATRLLDACPALHVLCTSQVPLDVDGEHVVELAPLGLEDAVELFSRRATAQRARREHDTTAAVRDLCHSLDGLPLAIELAAARTRTLSVEEITRRLDDRFAVLSDPTSRKPERRRALGATIRWSYDLLFPDDQRGLWALATFAGGAPLAAVEYVLDALGVPAASTVDIISRLASRSLVIVDHDDSSGQRRYRLLDSIRAFALDAMGAAGHADTALAAHARWYADAARLSTAGVRGSRQAEHLAFARTERANIDAALAWSATNDPARALDIGNGFGWAWVVLGDSRGAQRVLMALAAAGDTAPPDERATALLLASWLEASTGDLEFARRHIADAEATADAIDDDELRARSRYHLAYVVSHDGEFEQAIELTDQAAAVYRSVDRPWDRAANALFAARAAISAGDVSRAVDRCEDVQQCLAGVDDPWLHVRRDAMLGELARLQHRFDDAVDHIARAAETSHQRGYLQTEAYQVASLGRAQCQNGDHPAGCGHVATGHRQGRGHR